jgi:hypothetical protein
VGVPNSSEGKAMEISARQLAAGYINPEFFYSEASGEIVFWCPVNGATTENTEYPRSELREVIDPLDDNVNWGAPGTHVLEARCRVREVPSSQKVIIGQIHSYSGKARPLIKLQFYKGMIEALVKESPAKGKDIKLVFPEVGLDRDFTFQIKLEDGLLSVTVNDDDPVEHSGGFPSDDPSIGLRAATVRGLMFDQCVMVDQVFSVDHVRAIELALCAATLEQALHVEAQKRAAQGDHRRTIAAIRRLPDIYPTYLQAGVLMHAHVTQPRIATEIHLNDGVGEVPVLLTGVRLNEGQLCVVAHRDENSGVGDRPI